MALTGSTDTLIIHSPVDDVHICGAPLRATEIESDGEVRTSKCSALVQTADLDNHCEEENAELALITAEANALLQPEDPSEDAKPQEPKGMALGGFDSKCSFSSQQMQDLSPKAAEVFVERLKVATEDQIKKTLSTCHRELLSNMNVLMSQRTEYGSWSRSTNPQSGPCRHVPVSIERGSEMNLRTANKGEMAPVVTTYSSEKRGKSHARRCSNQSAIKASNSMASEPSSTKMDPSRLSGQTEITNVSDRRSDASNVCNTASALAMIREQKRRRPGARMTAGKIQNTARSVLNTQKPKEQQMLSLAMGPQLRRSCHVDLSELTMFREHQETPIVQKIVRSTLFDVAIAVAICSNAIFIGLEVHYITAHPERTFPPLPVVLISYGYTLFFVFELVLRALAEGCKFLCGSDAQTLCWNYADIFIVCTSLGEAGVDVVAFADSGNSVEMSSVRILRFARLFRVVRVLRLFRIVRFLGALRTLVYSIFCTLKSIFWAMFLMATIIYVFAIIFTQAAASYKKYYVIGSDHPEVPHLEKHWGSISSSMLTLFMSIAGGISWVEVIHPLEILNPAWLCIFLLYICFTYFAVLNVVTGVFCQAAMESNSEDHDQMMQTVLRHRRMYISRFKEIFAVIDNDESGKITLAEFVAHMEDENVKNYFASLDLQCEDALCLFDLFDESVDQGIEVDEFVLGCLRLKGTARSSDMIRVLHGSQETLETCQAALEQVSLLLEHFGITGSSRGPKMSWVHTGET